MIVALLGALSCAMQPPLPLPSRDSSSLPRRAEIARIAPPDVWLGGDKVKHSFLAGFTLAGSFAVARAAGVDRRAALVTAAVPTAVLAFGKETHDRRAGGRFSVRDLAADALGAAAYAVLLARTTR